MRIYIPVPIIHTVDILRPLGITVESFTAKPTEHPVGAFMVRHWATPPVLGGNIMKGIYEIIKFKKQDFILLAFVFGIFMSAAAEVGAGEFFVDKNNTTGTEDGTTAKPYNTIQEAIFAATGEGPHSIKVAQGEYHENVRIDAVIIHLLGGFEGGTSTDYTSGTGGVFDQQDPVSLVTRIEGIGTSAVVALLDSGSSIVDGFTITGGTGFADEYNAMGGGVYVSGGSPAISRNIIEDNDTRHAELTDRGGGITAEGSSVQIIGNVVRNNFAGRGGGIAVDGDHVVIQGNTISGNTAVEDHGGGLYLSGQSATIFQNLFSGNEVGRTLGYGWGGGAVVLGEESSADLSYNRFTGNYAATAGGGVFVDDSADVALDHEVIVKNQCQERGGAGIYVDGAWDELGSTCSLGNCTVADNLCISGCAVGGSGLLVEYYSVVSVENSIFWTNGGDDFYADEDSQITITYTDSQETVAGMGNLSADPFFADTTNSDYHLQSKTGRWDPGTRGWVVDQNQSSCIDVGNPASGFENELCPNGARINIGAYGNTSEASKSLVGECPPSAPRLRYQPPASHSPCPGLP